MDIISGLDGGGGYTDSLTVFNYRRASLYVSQTELVWPNGTGAVSFMAMVFSPVFSSKVSPAFRSARAVATLSLELRMTAFCFNIITSSKSDCWARTRHPFWLW